jgi:endo-1,4-beta-D-glucanase Y
MRKTCMLLALALIAMMNAVAAAAQNKPFPQAITYPGCIKPNNVSQATLNSDVLAYYTYWKGQYLKRSAANASHYYIAAGSTGGNASAVTQSEAHGYGMVVVALMAGADPNAKVYYDGLYGLYDTHRSVNNSNLMQWQVFADERNANLGSATDGDMDIAYSLLLAHNQWGSGGAINYLAAANRMITNGLKASCVYSTLRLGLSDDRTSDLLSTRPSDWMFDHMRAFKATTNDVVWDQLAANLYSIYNTIYTNNSSATGLISDFVMYDPPRPAPPGQPQADEGSTTGDYYYNACRVPLRLVMDFAHYGTAAPKPYLTKMVSWAKSATGNNPSNFQAGYKLNGTPLAGANYQSACFISPMIAAGVTSPANQQWVNDGWSYMKNAREGYYEDSFNMLCVLFVSGNWWVPGAAAPTNQAPTVALTSPTNGARFSGPATVALAATAADADGSVARVEFFNGSQPLGMDMSAPYTFAWTNVGAGTYTITAKATDDAGTVATSAAVSITVANPPAGQSPYGGTAAVVPGTVQAENYDLGGQGVAFNDLTPANLSGAYRTDAVDIEASAPTGYNVDYVATGEWLEYTINVTSAGAYDIDALLATSSPGKSLRLELDGAFLGDLLPPNTGGWQNWQTVTLRNISLPAGQKILRIYATSTDINIDKLVFTKVASLQSPFRGTAAAIPGTIEAEDYDLGGPGVAFNDVSAANEGGAYRTDAVDIEAIGAGTYDVGWMQTNEWLEYTVDATAGTYTVEAVVAATSAGKSFRVEVEGVAIGTFAVPNTGGWQNWQTIALTNVPLTAGRKVLRVTANTPDFNLDKITFSSTGRTALSARATTKAASPATLTVAPNPFPKTTWVEVLTTEAGDVSVEVYNTAGQLVKTLARGYLSAGTHRFACDAAGWPADLYLIRCSTRAGTTTSKIIKAQ